MGQSDSSFYTIGKNTVALSETMHVPLTLEQETLVDFSGDFRGNDLDLFARARGLSLDDAVEEAAIVLGLPLPEFQDHDPRGIGLASLLERSERQRSQRLLFNLVDLRRYPDRPVLIVESADSAIDAMYGYPPIEDAYVVTTWAGHVSDIGTVDWTPLKVRDVIIWPNAGQGFAHTTQLVATACRTAGARTIKAVVPPVHLPEGWTLSDDWPGGPSFGEPPLNGPDDLCDDEWDLKFDETIGTLLDNAQPINLEA